VSEKKVVVKRVFTFSTWKIGFQPREKGSPRDEGPTTPATTFSKNVHRKLHTNCLCLLKKKNERYFSPKDAHPSAPPEDPLPPRHP